MKEGDRIALIMVAAVGVLVPTIFILLDAIGVDVPNLSLADARIGMPTGTCTSMLVSSIAFGLGLCAIGFNSIMGADRIAGTRRAGRLELQGWLSVAAGTWMPALSTIALTGLVVLPH